MGIKSFSLTLQAEESINSYEGNKSDLVNNLIIDYFRIINSDPKELVEKLDEEIKTKVEILEKKKEMILSKIKDNAEKERTDIEIMREAAAKHQEKINNVLKNAKEVYGKTMLESEAEDYLISHANSLKEFLCQK